MMKRVVFIAICIVGSLGLISCGSTSPCGLSQNTKTNIEDTGLGLDFIEALPVKQFNYITADHSDKKYTIMHVVQFSPFFHSRNYFFMSATGGENNSVGALRTASFFAVFTMSRKPRSTKIYFIVYIS